MSFLWETQEGLFAWPRDSDSAGIHGQRPVGVNEQVMLQWGVYLLIVFCFLEHCVVCVFLVCLRETGEAKQPKTMMLCSFRRSSCLKLTETFSVFHVEVWENDLNSDPQNMLQGLFILQSFWKRGWRERGNMGQKGTVLAPQYVGGACVDLEHTFSVCFVLLCTCWCLLTPMMCNI